MIKSKTTYECTCDICRTTIPCHSKMLPGGWCRLAINNKKYDCCIECKDKILDTVEDIRDTER